MKKSIIIVITTVSVLIIFSGALLYYMDFKERREGLEATEVYPYYEEWVERLNLLRSDETYVYLGDFFEEIRVYLEMFIDYLDRNNLFEELTNTEIEFARAMYEATLCRGITERSILIIFDGEVITNYSDGNVIDFFEEHNELLTIIKEISKDGVMRYITIPKIEGEGVQVSFGIWPEYTEFTERLVQNTQNTFFYIRGEELSARMINERQGRNIFGNWYMLIQQPWRLPINQPPNPL